MDNHNWDLIVAGGGLCGLSAAITAQGKGLNVLLVEKRDIPGNGFHIDELAYPHALKQIFSDYENLDNVLTPLRRRAFWIVTDDAHTAWECVTSPDDSGKAGFVANRPKLDYALFDRFIALGGELHSNEEATDLILDENGVVIGVGCGDDEDEDVERIEHYAPLTVIADGPDSKLAGHLLKRRELNPDETILIIKETLTAEDCEPSIRMTGSSDNAASVVILGDPLDIGFSWARLIAHRNKIVIKAYVPHDLLSEDQNLNALIEQLKMHPSIEPIIQGFESESFTTQTIPVAGFEKQSDVLWGEGFIISGKAARLYHPFDCRMTDYSIVSGVIAGKAAVDAHIDRRESQPHGYPRMISETFLMRDRNSMSDFMNEMRVKPQFRSVYPQMLLSITEGIFTMDARSKGIKKSDIEKSVRSKCSIWDTLSNFHRLFKLYG
ncbi:NAD(P)/FAD-dependent oxidoreductase [bacterium]|nr:NAD(P)/FAD-dependent oxidoreductase [bacterium]